MPSRLPFTIDRVRTTHVVLLSWPFSLSLSFSFFFFVYIEYVDLYVNFELTRSVERQFSAFKRGFDMVAKESLLQQFAPEEVQLLVVGSTVADFSVRHTSMLLFYTFLDLTINLHRVFRSWSR